MKIYLYFVFYFLGISLSFGQFSIKRPASFSLGYYGETMTHPGLKTGLEYELKTWEKRKERKRRTVVKKKKFFAEPQVIFYTHPKNHSALILNIDWGYAIQKEHGRWQFNTAIGLGYLRQFNAGLTYALQEDGSIQSIKFASRGYFLPSYKIGMERYFQSSNSVYLKSGLIAKLKHNSFTAIYPVLEIGFRQLLSTSK